MNPGYAGRTELPESVKALFRPVTCIMPDKELICLISLFSDGFLTAKVLAKKMTVLYKLAEEQLSKQFHYDWGLRSLNSVLRMAGVMQRRSPELSESLVLMRVLRDMNFPKFVFDDVPLFLGLIKVFEAEFLLEFVVNYSLHRIYFLAWIAQGLGTLTSRRPPSMCWRRQATFYCTTNKTR